jgi:hypothetical protein
MRRAGCLVGHSSLQQNQGLGHEHVKGLLLFIYIEYYTTYYILTFQLLFATESTGRCLLT